jgi:hypothetical protein
MGRKWALFGLWVGLFALAIWLFRVDQRLQRLRRHTLLLFQGIHEGRQRDGIQADD